MAKRLLLGATVLFMITASWGVAQKPELVEDAPAVTDKAAWHFALAFPMIWVPSIHGRILGGMNLVRGARRSFHER